MKKNKFLLIALSVLLMFIILLFLVKWSSRLKDDVDDLSVEVLELKLDLQEMKTGKNLLEEENKNLNEKTVELSSQLIIKENIMNETNKKYEDLLEKLGITTEDYFGDPIMISEFEYIGSFQNGDKVYIEPYNYNVQEAAWTMLIVRDDLIIEYVSSSPSKPKFNKDNTKILYVDSLQFEAIGNVSIYDSEKRKISIYTSYTYDGAQETVKDVEWYDENSVLFILGFATGTVSQGGLVYYLDLQSQEMVEVIPEHIFLEWTDRPFEVVDVDIEGDKLMIMLVEWSDDNYEDFYYTSHEIFIVDTYLK